jgi:hypothetical protein
MIKLQFPSLALINSGTNVKIASEINMLYNDSLTHGEYRPGSAFCSHLVKKPPGNLQSWKFPGNITSSKRLVS